jgi:hypothetical protein
MRRLTGIGLIALISVIVVVERASAQGVDDLAGKRVMFLGDSITNQGGYISMIEYFLHKEAWTGRLLHGQRGLLPRRYIPYLHQSVRHEDGRTRTRGRTDVAAKHDWQT